MRLIDADTLIPIMKYTTTDNEIGVFPIRIGFDAIKGVIDEVPTIDAVKVIRCKNCIFYEKALSVQGFCHNHRSIVDANAFCSYGSYGKHREDGEI